MDCLERLAPTDGLALRFHRVLQYQLYLRYEQDVKSAKMAKSKGTKNSSIAIELFLSKMYADDWRSVEQEVKDVRREKFHYRKTLGKRLQVLCDNLGYGVLLLGSRRALRSILKEMKESMMEPFLCYTINTYPELPELLLKLDGVARAVLEGCQLGSLHASVEEVIPGIEEFLLTREGRFFPKSFHRIERRSLCERPISFTQAPVSI
ncbi:hypothetical protein VFPPC_11497 [Pochonia chlamydosporia 170]|uniref:Uncharacterized protein n=1 Tax=Pochonia chlamydosporia 170 TaxID=1380566 RepID=A0A179F1P1_METCM|nr:hypothetical protein VFPPC_11497 [Pochonia chlamydosporia 170]OAQ58999.1 hypothetical protein VFPPC_11497 [Pochonia chlamydosporia 170]